MPVGAAVDGVDTGATVEVGVAAGVLDWDGQPVRNNVRKNETITISENLVCLDIQVLLYCQFFEFVGFFEFLELALYRKCTKY